MPLARPRCEACSEPLGNPPYAVLPVRCGACGRGAKVEVGADGAPPNVDAAFPVAALLRWFAAARSAMAHGQPGVSLGPCPRCRAPLILSSRANVRLPCPKCQHAREGTAAELLVDQWPEPWARVEGADTALEYRVAVLEDTSGQSAGCAQCGAPTPPADPKTRCTRCSGVTWVVRGEGRRLQLGVRIDGTRDGLPLHALVPISQGEAMLRGDAARVASVESGSSLLGATGLGCSIAIALGVLFAFGMSIAVYFVLKK